MIHDAGIAQAKILTLAMTAIGATVGPDLPGVASIMADLGLTRFPVIEGAVFGALIFFLVGDSEGLLPRARRALAALLFSFLAAPFVVLASAWAAHFVSPDLSTIIAGAEGQKLIAALWGAGGVWIVEAYMRMLKDGGADWLVRRVARKAAGRAGLGDECEKK